MRRYRSGSTIAVALFGALTAGFIGAGAAVAHVSVTSPAAVQGGYASVTFKVPTESDTASTTGLKVQLPPDQPLTSVSVLPTYGWTHTVTRAKLATPISSGGSTITEAVSVIEWKSDGTRTAIKPGEFNQFTISVGPLPKAPTMTFKAIQTYSDGEVASWIEETAPGSAAEPEHPAPVLKLAAASPSPSQLTVSGSSDGGSDARANTALVLGALGVLLGAMALAAVLRSRRPTRAG